MDNPLRSEERLKDFMDEEDHAEWGGPTRVRDEYGNTNCSPTGLSTLERAAKRCQGTVTRQHPPTGMMRLLLLLMRQRQQCGWGRRLFAVATGVGIVKRRKKKEGIAS